MREGLIPTYLQKLPLSNSVSVFPFQHLQSCWVICDSGRRILLNTHFLSQLFLWPRLRHLWIYKTMLFLSFCPLPSFFTLMLKGRCPPNECRLIYNGCFFFWLMAWETGDVRWDLKHTLTTETFTERQMVRQVYINTPLPHAQRHASFCFRMPLRKCRIYLSHFSFTELSGVDQQVSHVAADCFPWMGKKGLNGCTRKKNCNSRGWDVSAGIQRK